MTSVIRGSDDFDTAKTGIDLQTAVAAAGTSIDFSNIPAGVKRITAMFNAFSSNGSSPMLVQIGAGSIQTTGYLANSASGATVVSSTAGFPVTASLAAASTVSGHLVLTRFSSLIWVASHCLGGNVGNITSNGGGVITLSGELDRLRFTTVNGVDVFDSGSVNLMWEF